MRRLKGGFYMKNLCKTPAAFGRLASVLGLIAAGTAITLGLAGCNTLQSIEVSREPVRRVYGQGQELDSSGLVVMGHFEKDSREVTAEQGLRISGYDPGKPGRQTVTVTMKKGLFSTRKSASFTVTVAPVERLSLRQAPATTLIMQGDAFDPAGLVAWAEFENGAVPGESIGWDRLRISGYNKDKAGAQTLTADYYGKRASFDVTVAALMGIAVQSPPAKTEYFTGEDFVPAGLVVIGTWEGMGEKPVEGAISGFDTTRAGEQQLIVSYSGKTTRFPVKLIALDALSVDRPPRKTDYKIGDDLDLSGMRVQGTWPGNSLALVDPSRLKIVGYDKFRMGDQKVTVTAGGKSDTFMVTVASPFEGTWAGAWGPKEEPKPALLRISNTLWELTTVDGKGASVTLNGVFAPDSGSHAKLQCDDPRWAGDVELNAAAEMRLSNKLFNTVLRKVN
jgi:hypothetical protein